MIHLGIPVINQKELTRKCLNFMGQSIGVPYQSQLHVVIIDNGSDDPYREEDLGHVPFVTSIIRNEENRGFYYPLLQLLNFTTSADLVGLMHNDLFIYEKNWDSRMVSSFVNNPRLGMVGVCGSDEIDDRGGRGGGTMCNFLGQLGQRQEHTGKRVTGVHPAIIFDSMFMLMRRPVVDALSIDEHITLCHFMDKLWPIKAMAAGWKCAVIGILVDHAGGQTSVLQAVRFDADAAKWCAQENIKYGHYTSEGPMSASVALYFEAERQFLEYGRSRRMIPSRL